MARRKADYQPPVPLPDQMKLGTSRGKMFLIVVIGAVFCGTGFYLLTAAPGSSFPYPIWVFRGIGVVSLLFGLAGVLFALASMIGLGSYLLLDRQGFEMASLGRKRRYQWQECSGFNITSIMTNRMIGFDIVDDDGRLARFNRVVSGDAAAIPDSYRIRIDDLAVLLNAFRDRALTGSDTTERRQTRSQ